MATRNGFRVVGAGLALVIAACGNGASAEADDALQGVAAEARVANAVDDRRDAAVRDGLALNAESADAGTQRNAADLFSGRWEGRLEGDGTAVITRTVDGYSVEIGVETSPPPESGFLPCMGGIKGKAQVEDEDLVLTQIEYGATCRIIMQRRGPSLVVEEAGPECRSYHGMSCGFSGTLQRVNAQSSNRPARVSEASTKPAQGTAVQSGTDKRDVAVTIPAGDGQMANCALGKVAGLAPRGDAFLAVRAGPGTDYRELDRLYNGQKVLLCDGRGDWEGIVYPADSPVCNTEGARPEHPYEGPCRFGWVHGRWVELLAG